MTRATMARITSFAARAACGFALCAAPLTAQLRPVFELAGSWAGNATGRAGDETYARLGDVRAAPTLGLGLGLMFRGFDVIAFGETGAVPVRGVVNASGSLDLTRNTFGLRVERPFARLPAGFRALGAVSALWQEFEPTSVRVPPNANAALVPVSSGEPGALRLDAQSWGGRFEVGVEHEGYLGTAWFLLAGATAVRDLGGSARTLATTGDGWRAVPTVTVGIRRRGW